MTPYYKRLSTPIDIFPKYGTRGGAGYENLTIYPLTQNLQLLQLLSSITVYREESNDRN